jgi:transposase
VAEESLLQQVARATSEPAGCVARAKALLAVASGATFTAAARAAGRRSGDGVALLVARFNRCGLAALERQPGGGPPQRYTEAAEARILREVRRAPDREQDGTATWSLTTLQRALRTAPDGLPTVSTFTILRTLHAAGFSWQESRTWCETGTALRKRKEGVVKVVDPQAAEKGEGSSERIGEQKAGASPFGVRTKPAPIKPSPNRALPGSRKGSRRANRTSTCAGGPPSC